MKAALIILGLASAATAAPSGKYRSQPAENGAHHLGARNSSTAGTKIILDNDWSTAGFIPYLLALDAGWDVLGLAGDTGDSWALQTSLHGLATLEVGNLSSCIPVYKGSDYPLVNTPELFQTWEDLHGDLPWVSELMRIVEVEKSAHNFNSKVLSPLRISLLRSLATTQHLATHRGLSRQLSMRVSPTGPWRAIIPPPGWSSRCASILVKS